MVCSLFLRRFIRFPLFIPILGISTIMLQTPCHYVVDSSLGVKDRFHSSSIGSFYGLTIIQNDLFTGIVVNQKIKLTTHFLSCFVGFDLPWVG